MAKKHKSTAEQIESLSMRLTGLFEEFEQLMPQKYEADPGPEDKLGQLWFRGAEGIWGAGDRLDDLWAALMDQQGATGQQATEAAAVER